MSKGNLLGQGRIAEVFAWGDGQVVKLMRSSNAQGEADYEARIARIVDTAGLSAPVFAGQVTVDGRPGLIFERFDGPTLLTEVGQRPWRLVWAARQLGALHAQMHSVNAPGLPSLRSKLEHSIGRIPQLTPTVKDRILRRVRVLPDGDIVCHGDFHPDNVIVSARGPVVIDWVTASHGPAAADVARTAVLFMGGAMPPGIDVGRRILIQTIRRIFYVIYLRTYQRRHPVPSLLIQTWFPILAAARLNEHIPEEEARWLAVVDAAFGK
ncbi:MAG: aminoglycoside phosphotransferase family protein [Caldilineaceae bacterium]|nr:aminoglycoside phosphotransferase family protein [Caldilineaceae bacterium]